MALWNGKQVWDAIKTSRLGKVNDGVLLYGILASSPSDRVTFIAHHEKMKVYKEVPQWAYAGMFVASLAMALATNYTAESGLPWWAFFIGMPRGLSLLYDPTESHS